LCNPSYAVGSISRITSPSLLNATLLTRRKEVVSFGQRQPICCIKGAMRRRGPALHKGPGKKTRFRERSKVTFEVVRIVDGPCKVTVHLCRVTVIVRNNGGLFIENGF